MSRRADTDPRDGSPPIVRDQELPAPTRPVPDELSRELRVVSAGRSIYQISDAQQKTLFDIGRFRTIALEDLQHALYRGHAGVFRRDLTALAAQGLVQQRRARLGKTSRELPVVVLTKDGKTLVESLCDPARTGQAIFAGFVKPSEVGHDAAIYRMFQAERRRIEREHGEIRRVVLDYELKRQVYTPLAKSRGLAADAFARGQAAVAREHHLMVIKGHIVLPDLRIEYQTPGGDLVRVDLELATHHYHASHMAAKAQAGFRFYAPEDSVPGLTRVLEERNITVEILSL